MPPGVVVGGADADVSPPQQYPLTSLPASPLIVSPSILPWQRLYEWADPLSFLHIMGLTWRCFAMLLAALFDPKEIHPPHGRWCGRLQSLRPEGCLGLLLFYLGRTMSYKHLCMIFGIVPGVCSKVVAQCFGVLSKG